MRTQISQLSILHLSQNTIREEIIPMTGFPGFILQKFQLQVA